MTQLLDRRFNALSLALIELQAVNAEEWRKFVILRGTARVSADMTLLTETIRGINEVKQKICSEKCWPHPENEDGSLIIPHFISIF